MSEWKSEIVVYRGAGRGRAWRPVEGEAVTARKVPAIVRAAGPRRRVRLGGVLPGRACQRPHAKELPARRPEVPRLGRGAAASTCSGSPPAMSARTFVPCHGACPTKKLHLAALRRFFDRLVNRHVCVINPAATVRAERYAVVEGKTPQIGVEQARTLLKSIDVSNPVGLRDRAVLAVLVYTAARVGAVAKLTVKSLVHDGAQYSLRFLEKGGKSREIPVRHDLEGYLRAYIERAEITEGPLFRTAVRKTKVLTKNGMTGGRHLSDDEAAAEGRRLGRPLLAALVPSDDRDGSLGAERAAGGRAVPGGSQRPTHDPDLRPAAAQGHAEYCRADLDLTDLRSSKGEREGGKPLTGLDSPEAVMRRITARSARLDYS